MKLFLTLSLQLRTEAGKIVSQVVDNYPGQNKTAEQAWDYLQRTVS